MNRKKSLFAGLLLATIVVFTSSSCKKCSVAESDSNTGMIIEDAIIYPKIGYLTGAMDGYYHITGASQYADEFEVSFDGGLTKTPVNYSSYHILANPMTIHCEASFVRDVKMDNMNSLVIYKVDANTCASCENERFIENYVLVPAIPSNFSVYFDQDIIENN